MSQEAQSQVPVGARSLLLFFAAAALLAGQSWRDKPAAGWSDEDAKEVLTDSPWAKPGPAVMKRDSEGQRSRGSLSVGGLGMGGRRMGGGGVGGGRMGGREGMGGGPGGMGGRPVGGGAPPSPQGDRGGNPPTITVRWESALPVQEAHLKMRHTDAPEIDSDSYTITVVGLNSKVAGSDPASLENHLKNLAELRRDGAKPLHSTNARVLPRDDGLIVVFTFSRKDELPAREKSLEFKVQIGPFEVTRTFDLTLMTYHGKLEL